MTKHRPCLPGRLTFASHRLTDSPFHVTPHPPGTHRVLYDGQELASGRPLDSYGIGKGSVLELLPLDGDADDPEASTTLPDGSPLLTSPSHGLHAHWQRARQGLAAGTKPKLAAAGTGGSYFLQDTEGNSVAVFKPQVGGGVVWFLIVF